GDDLMALEVPDLDTALRWIHEEIDAYLGAGWNKQDIGLPDLQGPLNIAMRVVGDTRLLNLIARPAKAEIVQHVLEVTSDAYIAVFQALRRATGKSAAGNFTIAGCSYMYLGPTHWQKFCLPVVRKCEVLGAIGLHHCGEAPTEKIEAYAQYPWTSVELGFGSDLKRARELFVHPRLGPVPFSCRISPYRMLNQTADQIRQDVEWICANAKGGPVSINVVGVPLGTPEENLWAMYDAVQDFNKQKEMELENE
ncbi:MAG TPA: uroporphyrinogen decarboxylase family protein, partial [Candidatus Lokiarchaeia archaeon]|nr:uroporphyrinogen decarboxylase family protein [Candidatus Lokiarchaeia archaeon]